MELFLQEPPGDEVQVEAHLLCKCLFEPGIDSGKLLNYFKKRTKVLSLPLSSLYPCENKTKQKPLYEPSDNDQPWSFLARAGRPGLCCAWK